jgi:dolichol-phosphate mannosyltransferase
VRVAVVVPTYNEAGTIVQVCERIRAALPDAEVVVVDDASPDGTAALVRQVGERMGNIVVLDRGGKHGLAAAYRAGFALAIARGAEICVQLDADLSHDPAVLPALVSNVEHGADLAIGSRYVPGGATEHWPWRRRALSRWGNRYAAGVLGLAVNDATAGLRAYSVEALRRMDFDSVTTEGYGFQIEMTHRLVRAEGKIVEFPITFRERTVGQSKLSNGIVNEAFLLVIRLWLQDMRGRRQRRRHSG